MVTQADYGLIRQAIANKTNIAATYQGHARELSPHAIGMKNGRRQALCLQFGGTSSSGLSTNLEENWRCLPVDALSNVRVMGGSWQTAANHSTQQTCIDDIDLEVSY